MPIYVDIDERRAAISEATHRVARRAGIRGVTIRAVAEELGASTSVVTNYLPSRAALLANAIDAFTAGQEQELEKRLRGKSGRDILRALFGFIADNKDPVRDALWIELLALPEREREVEESLRRHAEWFRSALRDGLLAAAHPDPEAGADMIQLFLYGVAASSVEDRTLRNEERLTAVTELFLANIETATHAPLAPAGAGGAWRNT
jgi:AcrR family transcriptional regulator